MARLGEISEDEWRRHWPSEEIAAPADESEEADEEVAADAEPDTAEDEPDEEASGQDPGPTKKPARLQRYAVPNQRRVNIADLFVYRPALCPVRLQSSRDVVLVLLANLATS